MAISQATTETMHTGNTPTSQHYDTIIDMSSIIDHVPYERDEPAPDGLFEWLESLGDPPVFAVAVEADIPHYSNWLIEQHAVWFREGHASDEPLTNPPGVFKVVDPNDTMVPFPGAGPTKETAHAKPSTNDSSTDDGKVSGSASAQTSSSGSTQSATSAVQRDAKPSR